MNIVNVDMVVTPMSLNPIRGFVELRFIDTDGKTRIKVRGITIKEKSFGLCVDFPAYSGQKEIGKTPERQKREYYKSFLFDDPSEYHQFQNAILKEYGRVTKSVATTNRNENVDPSEIPF